nr:DNA topoisomerase I {peptide 8} [Micrococcus luteus, Peptide Partial, 15 aa] [Micrococcus luteus]
DIGRPSTYAPWKSTI